MDSLSLEPIFHAEISDTVESFSDHTVIATTSSDARTQRLPARSSAGRTNLQRTLHNPISCVGIGLHTGRQIRLRLEPAAADCGIVFHRTDLSDAPIRALYDTVIDTRLSTVVADPENPLNRVATIEHLMAALHGCSVDNVNIFVDGPEIPVLDGSARDFLFLLDCAGITQLETARRDIEILKTVRVEDRDAFAELAPSSTRDLAIGMTIDFPARAIGRQSLSFNLDQHAFRRELACSRTFTNQQEIAALHAAGLARGGSLDNAIVVEDAHVLNPLGLRTPDEFVRHKVLDAVGDLYLAGGRLHAHFTGYKSGHALNNRLLRAVFADKQAWRWAGTDRLSDRVYRMSTSRRVAA